MHLQLILIATLALAANSLRVDEKWAQFKLKYAKVYHPREEAYRKSTWLTNLQYIDSHNSEAKIGKHSYFLKMNQFGDMNSREFYRKVVNRGNKGMMTAGFKTEQLSELNSIPDSVDWRNKSCVFPVREFNEVCNDMYAIDSAESISGMICTRSGQLVQLSAQQILDCSKSTGNMGCDGGAPWNVFSYVKQYGLEISKDYPLVEKDQDCRYDSKLITARINDFRSVLFGDEDTLTSVLATYGPVATYIDASNPSFQFYSSGVYYEPACNPKLVDHMLFLVGYGTQGDNLDYYIAKNSWGVGWGMKGYINLSRSRQNNCGVASYVSYPIVSN